MVQNKEKEYPLYDGYLEISQRRILFEINKVVAPSELSFFVEILRNQFESKYKDLKIFLLGRSSRHVCVENTSKNRRRFNGMCEYCKIMQQALIDAFNNEGIEIEL